MNIRFFNLSEGDHRQFDLPDLYVSIDNTYSPDLKTYRTNTIVVVKDDESHVFIGDKKDTPL